MNLKYLSTVVLLAILSVALGCTALNGEGQYKPKPPTVISFDSPTYKRVEKLLGEAEEKIAESNHILNLPLRKPDWPSERSLGVGERLVLPGEDPEDDIYARRAKRQKKATPVVVPMTTVSPSPLPEFGSESVWQAQAVAKPTPVAATSALQSADYFGSKFGYRDGQLWYVPWIGPTKSVHMGGQQLTISYKCTALVASTEHATVIEVTVSVKPSLVWESEYHRLVAIYGAYGSKGGDKNVVNADDVAVGARAYVGQWQEQVCALAKKMSLKDILSDPTLSFAATLTGMTKRDATSPFEILVQTAKVALPDELLRSLAKKGLEEGAKGKRTR